MAKKESQSLTRRIGGNRALVLGVMIVMLCVFTVDLYLLPALGVDSKTDEYVTFTVGGRAVAVSAGRFQTRLGNWQRFQQGQAMVTGRRPGAVDEFYRDLMMAELARDAGVEVTEGALKEFIQHHPMFTDSTGEFDPGRFDQMRERFFGGLSSRAFEEEAREYLVVDHFTKIYATSFLTVTDREAYERWKSDYPKVSVAFTWAPVAAVRATLQAADVKPEELESFWKIPAVQGRHKLLPRFSFEAATLLCDGVDDQAFRDAREEWKDDPDLKLGDSEAYEAWFSRRDFELDIAEQDADSVKRLCAENEARVRAEDEAVKKALPPKPREGGEAQVEPDLYDADPASLDDRELYRRYWQFRMEKETWLRRLARRILKEATESKASLAEVAGKRARPGLKARIHLQEDPVDQYGVEKIAGLGGPNCPLRWAINGYKPEQAGEYHKEVLEATANSSVLAERGWVAFRVLKVVPEAIPPLDDVREKVLGELLDDRARDRVRADLEALRKAAEDGRKPLEDAAKEKGLEVVVTEPFNAFSWRPPLPKVEAGREPPPAAEGWKDPRRRLTSVMSRYGAFRDSPVGTFTTVLEDVEGTGALYLVQVKSRAEPRFEEMTLGQINQVKRVITRERLSNVGLELSYQRLKDKCSLRIGGQPAPEPEEGRRGR